MTLNRGNALSLLAELDIKAITQNDALIEELEASMNRGHSFIYLDDLNSDIENPDDNRIKIVDDKIYRSYVYYAERDAANCIARLIKTPVNSIEVPTKPTEGLIVPTDIQWGAVENAFTNQLSIIQGLPGTGKSTLIRMILDAVDEHPDFADSAAKYVLAAPTGKAARRIEQTTNRAASTIHRLLGYIPGSGFTHNTDYPLIEDFIIVDEASMIDINLASSLLKAVGHNSRIVFIGDAMQLPPIGPGRFFEEILKVDNIPKTYLTEVFRQAKQSLIIRNAHRLINNETMYQDNSGLEDIHDDFIFTDISSHNIPDTIQEIVANRLPEAKGLDPFEDILVITAMKKGKCGTQNLNKKLQKALNGGAPSIGYKGFWLGDRVIQTKNDYDVDIMNGELGILEDVNDIKEIVYINFGHRQIWIPFKKLRTFELGYAITVHKSQGSQAPAVIFVTDKSQRRMLSKRLINTGITRAQLFCHMVGQWNDMNKAINLNHDVQLNSNLITRIQGAHNVGRFTRSNSIQSNETFTLF